MAQHNIRILDRLTFDIRFEMEIIDPSLSRAAQLGAAVNLALAAGIDLSCTDLGNADLRNTHFNLHLNEANLSKADLSGLDLSWASFDGAILDGASLRDGHFRKTSFRAASLREANFDGTFLERVDLSHTDCAGASFRKSYMLEINATEARFHSAVFEPECCYGNFDLSDFSGASFRTLAFEVDGDFRLDNVKFDPAYRQDFLACLASIPPEVVEAFAVWLDSDAPNSSSTNSSGLSGQLTRLIRDLKSTFVLKWTDAHPHNSGQFRPAAQLFKIFKDGVASHNNASQLARGLMVNWISDYASETKSLHTRRAGDSSL